MADSVEDIRRLIAGIRAKEAPPPGRTSPAAEALLEMVRRARESARLAKAPPRPPRPPGQPSGEAPGGIAGPLEPETPPPGRLPPPPLSFWAWGLIGLSAAMLGDARLLGAAAIGLAWLLHGLTAANDALTADAFDMARRVAALEVRVKAAAAQRASSSLEEAQEEVESLRAVLESLASAADL